MARVLVVASFALAIWGKSVKERSWEIDRRTYGLRPLGVRPRG